MNMHTMQELPNGKGWAVGYWRTEQTALGPAERWETICEFSEEPDALNRVNQLNGGPGISV